MKTRELPFGIRRGATFHSNPMKGERQTFAYVTNDPSLWQRVVAWWLAPVW